MTPNATANQAQPDQPTVVYDGECAYCRRQVQKMQRRDPDRIFAYVPRQTEGLTDRFPKLAEGDFNAGMRLIHEDGSISVGADAVYNIARRLVGWKRLAWLYRVPGLQQVFRAGYGWIAKNRHRLAKRCEDGACEI